MTDFPPAAPAYDAFEAAARSLREAELRRDLTAEEIPAPAGVAPRAIAFAGDVHPPDHGIDSQLGTGRFILLHDPEQPEPWDGDFRIVVYAQAPLEREIARYPKQSDAQPNLARELTAVLDQAEKEAKAKRAAERFIGIEGMDVLLAWWKSGISHPAPAEVIKAKEAAGMTWREVRQFCKASA